MPYAVLPALIPDIAPVYDVYFEAFKGEKILDFLFPGGVDRTAHTDGTKSWWMNDRNGYTSKCVDSDTGTIVGMASWEVFWRPGIENMWKKPSGAEWLTGDDRTRAESVLVPLWNMREKLLGEQKHVYCVTMAVHPEHRRKGLGRLLLNWGINLAEQLAVPLYLESTEGGLPLYKSAGFERLTHEKVVHQAAITGDKEDVEVPLMVKMPNQADGTSFEAWQAKGYPQSY